MQNPSQTWRCQRPVPRTRRARRGAVLVLLAAMLVMLFTIAALSIDAGQLFQERRMAQVAADGAAEAAAVELYSQYQNGRASTDLPRARAAALEYAAAHGFGGSDSHATVTVNIPPQSGAFAGEAGCVEVLIKAPQDRIFSQLISSTGLDVTARAVASGTARDTMASVLVLDPKRKNALNLKKNSSALEVSGDVIVNSANKKAVKVSKKAQIKARNVLVSGGIDRKSKGLIDGDVQTGVKPTDDPFVDLPAPPKGPARDIRDYLVQIDGQKRYDLQPGTYKEMKFDRNDIVRMAPGIYYLDGKFELRGEASLQAPEVMLYNAGKKGFKFQSKGEITITAPKSGTYQGIALFQGRSSKAKVEFKKDHDLNITGLVYAPTAEVKFNKSDADLGGDDEDWELEDDDADDDADDDLSPATRGSLGAAIIAKKLSIDKKSIVRIRAATIAAKRPIRGIVE